MALTIGFKSIDGAMLASVGGKAANLGELTRAGLPVPQGFCVTTDACRAVARADEHLSGERSQDVAGNRCAA